MPAFDGISVTIRVDGVDIPEFTVEKDLERRRVSCWVPSQVDKEFEVIVNSGTRAGGPWGADVVADGIRAYNPIFLADQSCNVAYFQKSATVKCPFVFSKLELVDDDALLHSSQGTRIGEIEISCYTVEITNTYYNPEYNTTFADNSKVHERSKKGLSEHIGFKKELQGRPCKFFSAENLDHIATFIIRYRPLAYLQAQGIVSTTSQFELRAHRAGQGLASGSKRSSASTSNMIKKGTVDNPLEVSDVEIAPTRAHQDKSKAHLKRKQATDDAPQRKKVKQEQPPASVPIEVIDLT